MSNDTTRIDIVTTGAADVARTAAAVQHLGAVLTSLANATVTLTGHWEDTIPVATSRMDALGKSIKGLQVPAIGALNRLDTQLNGLIDTFNRGQPARELAEFNHQMDVAARGGRAGTAWSAEISRINALNGQVSNLRSTAATTVPAMTNLGNATRRAGEAAGMSQWQQFISNIRTGMATAGTFAAKLVVLFAFFAIFRTIQTIFRGIINGFKELDEAARKAMSAMVVGSNTNVSYGKTLLTIAYHAIKFRTSVKDVGDVLWELKSAGLSAAEANAGLATSLRLLNADIHNVGMNTRLVAAIYMAFKDQLGETRSEAEKFAYIGDVLAYTLNKSQVDLPGLIDGLKSTLAIAKTTGIEFEFLMSALATLNNQLMLGPIAGTGFRAGMAQVAQDLDKIVEKYGLVVDASESLGSQIMSILDQLHERVNTGSLSLKDMAFWFETTGLRGSQALVAMIQHFPEIKAMYEELKTAAEGSLKAMSDIRMQSFTRNWEAFKTGLKSLGAITFGGTLGEINKIVSALNDVMASLVNMTSRIWTIKVKAEGGGDNDEDLWWAQHPGLAAIKQILVGGPGTNLWKDWGESLAGGFDKLFGGVEKVGDGLDDIISKYDEAKKAMLAGFELTAVQNLDVSIAEGTATIQMYNDAIGEVGDRIKALNDEIVALRFDTSLDPSEATKKMRELTESLVSSRKELVGLKDKMKEAFGTLDMRSWALDTLFKTGDISKMEYLAESAKDVNAAIAEANKLWAEKPDTAEAFAAIKEAQDKLNSYIGTAREAREAGRSIFSETIGSMGIGDEASISSIKDRIWYMEQFKRTLSDPSDILETDRVLKSLYETLGGKGVNTSWDVQKLFEEMINLGKQLADPAANLGNAMSNINTGPLNDFNANIEGLITGKIPNLTTAVTDIGTTGFGAVNGAVDTLNGKLNTTNGTLNEILTKLIAAKTAGNLTGSIGIEGTGNSRALKLGD